MEKLTERTETIIIKSSGGMVKKNHLRDVIGCPNRQSWINELKQIKAKQEEKNEPMPDCFQSLSTKRHTIRVNDALLIVKFFYPDFNIKISLD